MSDTILTPIGVIHLAAHAGGVCASPNDVECSWRRDAEQIVQDLAAAGYAIVPMKWPLAMLGKGD